MTVAIDDLAAEPRGPWGRVSRDAVVHVGSAQFPTPLPNDEPPVAVALLDTHGDCWRAIYEGPSWALALTVAARDFVPVITAPTRVELAEPDSPGERMGFWLAPGAPVEIDLHGDRPQIRLLVAGIDAMGAVDPSVVGPTYRPDPFIEDNDDRLMLSFPRAMPLFTDVDRGAFAIFDLRSGELVLGDGSDALPMSHSATFTAVELDRNAQWVEVAVVADDGSYRFRGLTPSSAVQARTPGILGMLRNETIEVPQGTTLYDAQGVAIAMTTADGQYDGGANLGRIRLPTPWGDLHVWRDRPPDSPGH